jgi:amino-acid N-acetyltransferase
MTESLNAAIRPAEQRDLAAVERLLTASGLPTDGIGDLLATQAGDFFVAETEAAGSHLLVGVAGLEVCGDNALLRSVAVRPEWRSTGVGRELVRRIVCHAEARGINALYLLTMTAEHYFPRFGFELAERDMVPPEISATCEFKSACPASAKAMMRALT